MGDRAGSRAADTKLFYDVFNASPIGIVVENFEGQPLFVNRAFCSMLGSSEEEIRSKHCVDFSPPEDAEKDWALFQQLRAGSIDHYQLEKRYFRKDGSVVWGSLSISLLNADPSPLVLAMVEDITEKKKTEEARFRQAAIINSSDDAIVSGTPDGIIGTWNAGAQKIYGYTESEAIGKSIKIIIPPELWDEENKIFETLRAGGRIEHFETVRVTKAGTRINVSLTISPIQDSEGSTVAICGIARDITDRKQAQNALRKSEERFRLAAHAAKMYSFEWDVTTDAVSRSPEHLRVLGVTEPLRLTHHQFLDKIHPDDRASFIATIAGLTPEKPSATVTYRLLSPDGSFVWLRSSGRAFFDDKGSMLRVVGMVADVTESKRAEQDLALAHERLHLAMEGAGAGIWDFDLRTGRNHWFGKAHAQLGMASDETQGSRQEFWDHVHEDDRQRLREAMQVARDKHADFVEDFRVVWRNGTTRWLRSRGRFQYAENSEPERFLGISLDITENKQAELALHAREELLRTFVKNVPVAVAMLDRNLRYVQVSDRWCSDNSVEASQLLGQPREAFPEMPERWKEVNRRALQGETVRVDEDSWESAGSTRWARWEVRPWREPDGTIGGILVFAEDITRRKQMEEEILDMGRKLIESQEQERARIGRELHDDISQRLAMLAVELDQLKQNPSEVESRVKELRKRTNELSNDVQALSHDLHSSKLEYLGVIKGMNSWCQEFAERRRMEVNFRSDVESALPLDIGLPLFRVLQEALNNAFKHSEVKRVEVQVHEESGEIHLIVSDSGKGFDIEAARQGRGLGLTSMRERIRLINGSIAIQPKPMGGTTIHARVPFTSEHVVRGLAV